jgi:hypothetical protein
MQQRFRLVAHFSFNINLETDATYNLSSIKLIFLEISVEDVTRHGGIHLVAMAH